MPFRSSKKELPTEVILLPGEGTAEKMEPQAKAISWRPSRLWFIGQTLYVGALAALTITNYFGPEHWVWSSIVEYLPFWLWGIPGVLLLLSRLTKARLWAILPLACLLWVAGPLMGFCWPTKAPNFSGISIARLRVMTYNTDGQPNNSEALAQIQKADPDLLLLQEAGTTGLDPLLVQLHHWHIASSGGCLIASKLPFVRTEVRQVPLADPWRKYVWCQLLVNGKRITVVDIHLDTPREGFNALIKGKWRGLPEYRQNVRNRLARAAATAQVLGRETLPVLIGGDFNAPLQSLICRPLTALNFRDAFATAGFGYGYTYGHRLRFAHSYIRIDHIFVGPSWRVTECHEGEAEGSDHRPVIADLTLME